MTLSKFSLAKLIPAWPEGAFALRLVMAALLAAWAGTLLPGGHAFSAVISALLVVRPYQQGALKTGALRLLATAGGIVLAFSAQQLNRFGLNDYLRLILALVPLSLLAAYNSSYRTALIAAVLIMAAPAGAEAVHMAIARGVVVALGAAIGTLVSVVVLPSPHKHVVADKALKILALMIASLAAAAEPPSPKSEKAEGNLRKALLELGQMARDNSKGHRDDDESGRIVRLVRHAQAVSLLLRGQWRTREGDGRAAFCDAMLALIAAARQRKVDEAAVKAVWAALPPAEGIEAWMQKAVAGDVVAVGSGKA